MVEGTGVVEWWSDGVRMVPGCEIVGLIWFDLAGDGGVKSVKTVKSGICVPGLLSLL